MQEKTDGLERRALGFEFFLHSQLQRRVPEWKVTPKWTEVKTTGYWLLNLKPETPGLCQKSCYIKLDLDGIEIDSVAVGEII